MRLTLATLMLAVTARAAVAAVPDHLDARHVATKKGQSSTVEPFQLTSRLRARQRGPALVAVPKGHEIQFGPPAPPKGKGPHTPRGLNQLSGSLSPTGPEKPPAPKGQGRRHEPLQAGLATRGDDERPDVWPRHHGKNSEVMARMFNRWESGVQPREEIDDGPGVVPRDRMDEGPGVSAREKIDDWPGIVPREKILGAPAAAGVVAREQFQGPPGIVPRQQSQGWPGVSPREQLQDWPGIVPREQFQGSPSVVPRENILDAPAAAGVVARDQFQGSPGTLPHLPGIVARDQSQGSPGTLPHLPGVLPREEIDDGPGVVPRDDPEVPGIPVVVPRDEPDVPGVPPRPRSYDEASGVRPRDDVPDDRAASPPEGW